MAVLDRDDSVDALLEGGASATSMSEWLITKWCKGKSSAHDVLEAAQACVRSHKDTPDDLLVALSEMDPHNAHRSIERALRRRRPRDLPPVLQLKVPLWDNDRGCRVDVNVPVLPPHEYFDW